MLASLPRPKLVVADTMNLWISIEKPELLKLLGKIDGLVLNDGEARLLTEEKKTSSRPPKQVLSYGPKFVVIKKGEHGSLLVTKDDTGEGHAFVLPAYPAEQVVDPTGAGDSFAGGMMGYLATQGHVTPATVKRAMAYGTCVASFTIADFSLAALQSTNREAIDDRWNAFKTGDELLIPEQSKILRPTDSPP